MKIIVNEGGSLLFKLFERLGGMADTSKKQSTQQSFRIVPKLVNSWEDTAN